MERFGRIPPPSPPQACLRSYNQFCNCFFVEFRYLNWISFIRVSDFAPMVSRLSLTWYGSSKMASLSLYMTWCRHIYVAISTKYTNINPCKDLYSLFFNFRSYMKLLNDATFTGWLSWTYLRLTSEVEVHLPKLSLYCQVTKKFLLLTCPSVSKGQNKIMVFG